MSSAYQQAKQKKFKPQHIELHEKQGQAYHSLRREVLCCSGIQGGKSLVGALKLRRAIRIMWPNEKHPHVNFAVTAPDYKSMKQSTRDAFDRVFFGMGSMNEQDQVFNLVDGRKIFFRTMIKNPNSVEGIPSCVFIWADEAGRYPRMAYDNIVSRVALMQGQAFFTTTPYAMNWTLDVIDQAEQGDPEVDYFHWTSKDNPAFSEEEYERIREKMPYKTFRRKFMGIHEAIEGLIYDYTEAKNVCLPFPVEGFDCYGGVDWGFDHPFSVVIRCIPPGGHKAYTVSVFKKGGMTPSQMVELLRSKMKMFHVKHFYCGSDRPDMIMELNSNGIPASHYFESSKEHREVIPGIQLHAELIRSGRYQVFKDIDQFKDLKDEYRTYRWDKKEGEEFGKKEEPVKENDDLLDAERYVTIGTFRLMKQKTEEYKIPRTLAHRVDTWTPENDEEERHYEDL